MPTILNIEGFRFHFYSDEGNEPCHIHVKKGEARGKIWLEPVYEECYLYGFTIKEQKKIKSLIKENRAYFIKKWYEYFGR